MFSVRKHTPRAFTLVEMLVVMAIIGILVALLLPAVMSAMASAQRTRNGVDIAQLMQAIEMYKSEKGSYPPSMGEAAYDHSTNKQFYKNHFTNGTYRNTQLYRHIVTAYPKISDSNIEHMFNDVADKLDQSSALVFWLSQTSEDVRNPFTRQAQFRKFMDFDSRRLVQVGSLDAETAHNFPGMAIYHFKPPFSKESPYVYIDSGSYTNFADVTTNNGTQPAALPAAGTAVYDASGSRTGTNSLVRPVVSAKGGWVNPQTFQLFCAGLDGRFSSAASLASIQVFPIGHKMTGGSNTAAFTYDEFLDDRDNQTNFTDGKRIEDLIP